MKSWALGGASGPEASLGLVLAGLVAAALAWRGAGFLWRILVWRTALSHVRTVTARNLPALARRRLQLVRPDAYGKPQLARWEKEIDYFFTEHIEPGLTPAQRAAVAGRREHLAREIDRRVAAAAEAAPGIAGYAEAMSAAEFELFCAETLRRAGWTARVTPAGPDQGADILAEKAGRRVVLQCKKLSRPVGNKAVQEVVAARGHERAGFAAVVSNQNFTEAAEQLAASNGILLLHFRDLPDLDRRLGEGAGRR